MSELRIADDLALPLDAVTETFLIFGKKGSGKTHTAGVFTEELIGAGLPVAVIDPMGAWWGLRSNAAGDGPGLPVTILGGEHADLPLLHGSGAEVADLVVEERIPAVLDMFLMSKTQQRQFATDFMERLFRRNRDPMHLVIDEADRFAPQRGTGEMARLLGAYEDIVLRGRRLGIGSTSITLRVAQLHSAIRSQVEVLVAMRMLGKLDVQAIDEWIRLHASDEDARELKSSLPSLPTGTAWVWSPGWLEIMRKVQIRARRTFDSSATPKVGQERIVPREFARVDATDLERMAARLGGSEDPASAPAPADAAELGKLRGANRELRSQVTDLRSQLAAAEARPAEPVEVPVLQPGEQAAFEQAIAALKDITATMELALSRAVRPAVTPSRPAPAPVPARRPAASTSTAEPSPAGTLSKAQRAVLTVLAQFPDGRTRRQIAMLTGYSGKSGGFRNTLSQLRMSGLITRAEPVTITAEGADALGGDWDPLPAGHALIDHWIRQLGKAEGAILQALLDSWPAPMTKDGIAAVTGYSAASGGFRNALSRLRTLELIDGRDRILPDETLAHSAQAARGSTR